MCAGHQDDSLGTWYVGIRLRQMRAPIGHVSTDECSKGRDPCTAMETHQGHCARRYGVVVPQEGRRRRVLLTRCMDRRGRTADLDLISQDLIGLNDLDGYGLGRRRQERIPRLLGHCNPPDVTYHVHTIGAYALLCTPSYRSISACLVASDATFLFPCLSATLTA